MPHLACTLVALVAGCGARRGFDEADLRYFEVGADPIREADASSLALARAGYLIDTRLEASTFVAIAATRRRDRASVVRIFTTRGTALAIDAPDARHPARLRVGLAPASAPFDLDGHPGEELAVEVEVGGRRCVALVRITEEGGAFEVPLPLASLPGAPCAERLVDVVGDSRPELIATVRFDEVGTDPAPSVPIALEPARRGYRLLSPALAPVFFEGDRRSREAALADAAGPERIRLAVELAAIARISGKPREEAEAIFDRAVAGLDEALAEASSSARALVTAGLGLEPVLDGPP